MASSEPTLGVRAAAFAARPLEPAVGNAAPPRPKLLRLLLAKPARVLARARFVLGALIRVAVSAAVTGVVAEPLPAPANTRVRNGRRA